MIIRSTSELHPAIRSSANALYKRLIRAHEASRLKVRFEIYETFRVPSRQEQLRLKGVSKAGAFESAHQFGLAIDFVPFLSQAEAVAIGVLPGWYWPEITDEAWKVLKEEAKLCGLSVPISWDAAHVEYPGWKQLITRNI